MSSNSICVCGVLGKDAEIVEFNDKESLNFSIAEAGNKKDTPATWYGVRFHNTKLGELLKKGTKVTVFGSLTVKSKGDKTYLDIYANNVQVQGYPKDKAKADDPDSDLNP